MFYGSEKVKRAVKARDSYGQVMAAVQRAQAHKQHEALSRPDTPHDAGEEMWLLCRLGD